VIRRLSAPLIALAALGGAVAYAQISNPTVGATLDDVNAAIVAAIPSDCPAPLSDALVATAGSQARCMPRPDAQRATLVQSLDVTTAADGTFTGSWPAAFATAPKGYIADIPVSGTSSAPYKCSFITVTATGFSGKCYQIVATTLPTTATALLGLTISPLQNAAAGLSVRVIGRQ
jgi:hypothetical protein